MRENVRETYNGFSCANLVQFDAVDEPVLLRRIPVECIPKWVDCSLVDT